MHKNIALRYYLIPFSNSIHRVIRDYTKVLFLITSFRGLSSSKLGYSYNMHEYVYDDGYVHSIAIVFRQIATDINPGDLDSCMLLVQSVLPIALARPFVEQFIPKGTRVSVHNNCD